jgi:hypothetical protein
MKTQIKLHSFKDNAKFIEFIGHLETLTDVVTFAVVPNSDCVILRFALQNTSLVYYYTWRDYVNNNPIVAVGLDCMASSAMTDYDLDLLDGKEWLQTTK